MSNGLFQWLKNYFTPVDGVGLNLDRRKVLTTGIAAASGALFIHVQPAAGKTASNASYLRPPGAGEEEDFLLKCVRCGECMKACPTNAIQPAMLESGLKGMWTPLMNMRIGYCDIRCTTCMQVCPTGALEKMALAVKQNKKLGVAVIDRTRCLPTAEGKQCSMCEKQCPLTDKAITLESVQVTVGSNTVTVSQPKVNPKLCIGCGICENKCPVTGEAAIRVKSA
jgi:MauM/NapG family ferredoxin protein